MSQTNPPRLSQRELQSKMRYLKDEHNLGIYPLDEITGLHPIDRVILNQYVRSLIASDRIRQRPPNVAGYKGSLKLRKKMNKLTSKTKNKVMNKLMNKRSKNNKGKSKGKPKSKHTRRN
mgnify:CR=1 FL=1